VTTRRRLLGLGLLPVVAGTAAGAAWMVGAADAAAAPTATGAPSGPGGPGGAAAPAGPGVPAVLRDPALITPRAAGAAMLAVARAGRRLVAAGERGIVRVSDDDGATWSQARVPVQVSLTALHFADARRGWAAGHLGVILRTDDGGATWTRQLDGIDAARQVLAAAPGEAARQRAQRLVDEGPDKPFFDLDVAGQRGLAVGAYGLAVETRDGGAHWQAVAPARLPNPKSLHLYATRWLDRQLFIAGEQGLLMRSSDGGDSFEPLASPYKGSFFGLLATRAGSLIAYGLRGHAFRSTDAGSSWEKLETGVPLSLSAGIERADGSLLLLAQNGDLLSSRDDGRRFERLPAARPLPAAALAVGAGSQVVVAGLRGIERMNAP
jgi:photosystem II stability/assembly factor-like uncharacterized protein